MKKVTKNGAKKMKSNQLLELTLNIALSKMRPHGGTGVRQLSRWLRAKLPKTAFCDPIGNIHFDNRVDNYNRTLFVAHLDTVHQRDGYNTVIKKDGRLYSNGIEPLGADDGAGIALLMHLIDNNIPGYYIFTQGEERGGIGSSYIADSNHTLLFEFDKAIAFDRKSTHSIITHQLGHRCCSENFAETLSDELNQLGCLYAPDNTGVYTDTAEFTDFIPECTNISAGYFYEHTPNEYLVLDHFYQLASAIIKVNWDLLPVTNEKKETETSLYSSLDSFYDDRDFPSYNFSFRNSNYISSTNISISKIEEALNSADHGVYKDLLGLVSRWAYPSEPEHAMKFLSTKHLNTELIDSCYQALDYGNEEIVLSKLWDNLYNG